MKKLFFILALQLILMALFNACSSDATDNEITVGKEGQLSVVTRSSGDGTEVSYPLIVYIFKDGTCCAVKTIEKAEDNAGISLASGDYSVYAIGGVGNYVLPDEETATTSSVLEFDPDKSQTHGDLMVAQGDVTITAGQNSTLDFTMERKVMQVDNIKMENIPTDATQVSITISSLYKSIKIDGSYSDETTSYTLNLIKQEDGTTWSATPNVLLLPSDDSKITVNITIGSTSKTYTYSGTEKLVANSHFNITAVYQEQKLNMAFTGVAWDGTKEMNFYLTDNVDSNIDNNDDDDTETTTTTFKVGELYKNCYIFEVNEDKKIAKVLSPNECVPGSDVNIEYLTTNELIITNVDAKISSCAVEGITGWRVMTSSEAQILHDNFSTINSALGEAGITQLSTASEYKCTYYVDDISDDGIHEYKKCDLHASTFKVVANPKNETILRPVAEISF